MGPGFQPLIQVSLEDVIEAQKILETLPNLARYYTTNRVEVGSAPASDNTLTYKLTGNLTPEHIRRKEARAPPRALSSKPSLASTNQSSLPRQPRLLPASSNDHARPFISRSTLREAVEQADQTNILPNNNSSSSDLRKSQTKERTVTQPIADSEVEEAVAEDRANKTAKDELNFKEPLLVGQKNWQEAPDHAAPIRTLANRLADARLALTASDRFELQSLASLTGDGRYCEMLEEFGQKFNRMAACLEKLSRYDKLDNKSIYSPSISRSNIRSQGEVSNWLSDIHHQVFSEVQDPGSGGESDDENVIEDLHDIVAKIEDLVIERKVGLFQLERIYRERTGIFKVLEQCQSVNQIPHKSHLNQLEDLDNRRRGKELEIKAAEHNITFHRRRVSRFVLDDGKDEIIPSTDHVASAWVNELLEEPKTTLDS